MDNDNGYDRDAIKMMTMVTDIVNTKIYQMSDLWTSKARVSRSKQHKKQGLDKSFLVLTNICSFWFLKRHESLPG